MIANKNGAARAKEAATTTTKQHEQNHFGPGAQKVQVSNTGYVFSFVEKLLSRLDRVKQTRAGHYLACCPAHQDKSPSLTVREMPDGRVLIHCFAGCDVESVLAAVGLTFSDLFPPRSIEHAKAERAPFYAIDVLRALSHEALVVAIAAETLRRGKALAAVDFERLGVAVARIHAGVQLYA